MTEEELRRMIREALGRNTEGGEYQYDYPQLDERLSYAKQLPPGLLTVMQGETEGKPSVSSGKNAGTDGKQVMLQGNIPMPIGSLNVQGGYMPTYGQKMAGANYSLPIGEGELSIGGGVTTDPRMGAAKDINAAYSRKILEDLYLNAYVNQMLGQGSKGQRIGIGIQGLF